MAKEGDDPGELSPGEKAGQHVLTGFIARGGGGSVYSARHPVTGREAAVKILHRSLATLPKMVERFRREVEALDSLSHPNIVKVWEVGALPDGRPFFATELLHGRTVSKILGDEGRLAPRDALQIFEPVCEALAAAHAAGVIHRDVKTSNIMVEEGPPRRVKLLDFGVAKLVRPGPSAVSLTSEGTQLGTATCMSPEQILSGAVDARTDIYALGVLLYCLLTGRPPFVALSAPEIMRLHLYQAAPRPSARAPAAAALDAVVLRCMEKPPAHRYASVEELLSALRTGEAGSRAPRKGATRLGAAMYVEICAGAADSPDTASSDEVGSVLDASEDALRSEGLVIASATGNHVLGVRPLDADPAAATRQLKSLLRMAAALRTELDDRAAASTAVHTNLCLHVAEVLVRGASKLDLVGGPLMQPALWAPRGATPGVCVTRAAASILGDAVFSPGPGELLIWGGPSGG